MPVCIRKRIDVRGVVQGVGFRPFVFRTAMLCGIAGRVLNSSDGVLIEAEGSEEAVSRFLLVLQTELPPLARIDQIEIIDQQPAGDCDFDIEASVRLHGGFSLVPTDVATCAECITDFRTSDNRRFEYPFTNCTSCGPRYTIIRDVPYDRGSTTMVEFPMCPECRAEYEDPLNRRFHAEPNACPECGPSLTLLSAEEMAFGNPLQFCAGNRLGEVLAQARSLLRAGKILAVKGLGGFHLVCDARNESAVSVLRERKRRSGKAFAVMVRDAAIAEELCELSEAARMLLGGERRPIVLLVRRRCANVAASVAPGSARLGMMLPYTPLHHLLFDKTLEALVMTSGNHSEEPIVCENEEAWTKLTGLADGFLLHNRKIQTRVDDSVFHIFEEREYPVRRSRGYAPEPFRLSAPQAEVLACGGELKNTLCLTKGRYAIVSQHIGDLENVETMAFFRETLEHLRRFFRVDPVAVAHDLHPNYLTTRYALSESGLRPIGVQHHHAHIASCMADNELDGSVIGVAFDGTGYGTDGRIWGGEFLTCDFLDFRRLGHLRYLPLAGGDMAVRQPWRSALMYLRDTFEEGDFPRELPAFRNLPPSHLRVVEAMLARRIQTVETSSCGRLFDAVASLTGICQETTYEGQAAIELEAAALPAESVYPFEIEPGEPFRLDLRKTIESVVADLRNGRAAGEISGRFHATMARVVVDGCLASRTTTGLSRVCLSGGTFLNLRLLGDTSAALRQLGFEVFTHRRVPANDGGLSLGQAMIASRRLDEGRC